MFGMSWFKRVCAAVCLCGLAACAALFGPRTVEVSQAQLQQAIDRQFPLKSRVLDLFDANIAAPRLALHPDTHRIATEFDVSVGERLLKQPYHGRLALDGMLRFEPADNTVRVTDVRVERFEIDGLPAAWQRQLDRIGVQLAGQLLNDRAVYTLRARDVEALQGRGYRPGEIHVTPAGLAITLVPQEAR